MCERFSDSGHGLVFFKKCFAFPVLFPLLLLGGATGRASLVFSHLLLLFCVSFFLLFFSLTLFWFIFLFCYTFLEKNGRAEGHDAYVTHP